jgi:hypothetical protein
MPSQRIADAAHVAPYTHDVTHDGQATLTPPDNVGRIRQVKPKKSRQKQERNVRSEEDMKFDTGPRPLRNLVASRGARRQGRTGRQDRGPYNGRFDGNEDRKSIQIIISEIRVISQTPFKSISRLPATYLS